MTKRLRWNLGAVLNANVRGLGVLDNDTIIKGEGTSQSSLFFINSEFEIFTALDDDSGEHMRIPTAKEYCHAKLGARFETALSTYDTNRRITTLIDEFLGFAKVAGKNVLDVGCGLGFFSARLKSLGANVLACDIGESLVDATRRTVGCEAVVADAMNLAEHFGVDRFDVVVSSECIEHTPDPSWCLEQMVRVLKPGGWLSVSTPNRLWYPVVKLASTLCLRPFDGHENFSTFRSLRSVLHRNDVHVVTMKGLHIMPFQLKFYWMSQWCDCHLQFLRSFMINLCVLGRKNLRGQ
jgi:2-polyprenyl-6-hydroxyphenyl methylase/3-demethylubiquinone-9 3-methyltransferase